MDGAPRLARVAILAFGIDDLAEPAGGVDLLHRVQVVVEHRRLEHGVDQAPVFVAALQQPLGVVDVAPERRYGGADVLLVIEHLDAVPGMGRRVGCDEDRLDRVVFDHLLQRRISLTALDDPSQLGATVRKQNR